MRKTAVTRNKILRVADKMTALALSCQDGKIISGQEEHSRTERSLQDRKITPGQNDRFRTGRTLPDRTIASGQEDHSQLNGRSQRSLCFGSFNQKHCRKLNLKRGLKKTSPQCIIYLEVIKETVLRLMITLQISGVIFSYTAILYCNRG